MTISLSRRIFEIMIHEVKITLINTQNQQKTITHIIRQNASMHLNLKIARVIWSKRAKINFDKKYSSLIMKIYNAKTINRLIQKELFDEYSHRTCEYFDKDCRLKQCFNCQRYEHINKSCKYSRRCATCANFHNESVCNTSIEKRKCVNCEKNHLVWSFQCKIKIDEKNKLNDMWFFKSILHAKKTKKKTLYLQQKRFKSLIEWWQTTKNNSSRSSRSNFFFEKIFIVFKHKYHVFRNWQLHNTKIAEQTIIFTEIECNNFFVYCTLTKRQRFLNQ